MTPEARHERIRQLYAQLQPLRKELAELEKEDSRERQADFLASSSSDDFSGELNLFESVGECCEDLVYHAKRLSRPVSITWNLVRLVAQPDTDPRLLEEQYFVEGKRLLDERRALREAGEAARLSSARAAKGPPT